MKKRVIISSLLILLLIFTGCVSSVRGDKKATASASVGLDGTAQPAWVFKSFNDGDKHYESGYGKMSDRQTSMKRAVADARNKIASWVSVSVEEVLTNYFDDAGSLDDRQAYDALKSVSVQISEATLLGVTTEEIWLESDGGVWVLASIPLKNIENNFEPVAKDLAKQFVRNEAAEVASQKMNEALDKYFYNY